MTNCRSNDLIAIVLVLVVVVLDTGEFDDEDEDENDALLPPSVAGRKSTTSF